MVFIDEFMQKLGLFLFGVILIPATCGKKLEVFTADEDRSTKIFRLFIYVNRRR
jgi:hypothetical protein